jgi:adenylate cyclase
MPGGSDADEHLELVAFLKSVGVTDEEIAAHEGSLLGLSSRRVLFGDEQRVTVEAIAAMAGCDESLVRKVRLASGLPDGGDDAVCSPREAEVMSSFLLGAAVLGEDVALQFTRLLGNVTAGLAEAALATFAANLQGPLLEGGASLADIARAGVEATTALLVVPPVLDILLRLHFEYANAGRFAGADRSPTVRVAVAFVDLVDSTQLTQALDGAELARALGDFERVASESVVRGGGRVVKRIGDAVMFVASDAVAACEAALAIVAAVDAHPTLIAARAAIAFGAVLPRDGDYFGTAVNLAARAVPRAEPGTVVVDDAVRVAVAESRTRLAMTDLGEHVLKGFDAPVALFRIDTAVHEAR